MSVASEAKTGSFSASAALWVPMDTGGAAGGREPWGSGDTGSCQPLATQCGSLGPLLHLGAGEGPPSGNKPLRPVGLSHSVLKAETEALTPGT